MKRARQLVFAFLSRDLAGVWTAGGALAIGAVVAFRSDGSVRIAAVAVAGLGVLLLLGTLRHLLSLRRARVLHPPPGVLVKVRGRRIHVLAEGDAGGRAPVVWMPGGHAGGLALHHLHSELREEARSILIDRPGTGWSDPGPFPRTTHREAGEVLAALEAAGEEGPFVLAGHSFGGLLFAAVARQSPRSVAALLLMDATPPDTIVYGPPIPGLTRMRWPPVFVGVLQLFGLDELAERLTREPSNPEYERLDRLIREQLGEAWQAARALERGPRAACASASIFDELKPEGMASIAWTTLPLRGRPRRHPGPARSARGHAGLRPGRRDDRRRSADTRSTRRGAAPALLHAQPRALPHPLEPLRACGGASRKRRTTSSTRRRTS